MTDTATFTAFVGHRILASGDLAAVAAAAAASPDPALVFDDLTGRIVELDLRKGPEHAASELRARTAPPADDEAPARQGRGRPRLGVVAREVTLLPRHWAWLADQPGGASAALRRLVEDARRDPAAADRKVRETAYRVMTVLAGDLPGYEDAARALFAGDAARLAELAGVWPADVAAYVRGFYPPS
ncbi:MAG: DUF2239 family protein [Phenylobacterium sp.]|uniref:DUF2239 family protein n=1 Tax=Phenylobacterium sp. TaxID=1871053 RepID=UPI001A43F2E3|nr:DUF2239 family protein [Phenylobacterium sp.]MBL8552952.1 DUF2239 family protein [Phenylobacterium sp.]